MATYRFDVGMSVALGGQHLGVVACVDSREPSILVASANEDQGWYNSNAVTADIDHPGTRGLLLQQYRDASGHGIAYVARRAGRWFVYEDTAEEEVGEGESEGVAILDALTRLAASKAAAAVEDAGHREIATRLDGHGARLDRLEANVRRLSARLAAKHDGIDRL